MLVKPPQNVDTVSLVHLGVVKAQRTFTPAEIEVSGWTELIKAYVQESGLDQLEDDTPIVVCLTQGTPSEDQIGRLAKQKPKAVINPEEFGQN